ncbi:MAG: hypothetical protein ABI851_04375 [Saprospiraceae bacterium]
MKSIKRFFYVSLHFLSSILFSLSFAQERHSLEQEDNHQGHHSNHLALFAGATSNLSHNHNSFTLGLEYEYSIIKQFGIGIFAENLFGEEEEFVFGLPLVWHPIGGLKIIGAPLLEVGRIEDIDHPGSKVWHKEWGVRIGSAYDFHIGHIVFGPSCQLDFIHDNSTLVYGMVVGTAF